MDNESLEFTLPAAPRGLCFDRNDFVKTNFSVDNFLSDHQNVSSLETMRDDLGIYLKVLRLAMIDLINKDYANFVNLSATLIGFDKAIEKIQTPLVQLFEEMQNVKQSLDDAMKELMLWLNQRNSLRQKKQSLKYYSQTLLSLKSLSNILKLLEIKAPHDNIVLADRAVMQYNQLQFTISQCNSFVKPEQQNLFVEIGDQLTQSLNDLLFYYWRNSEEDNLLRALMTLASLDKVNETEQLVRKQAVGPCLQDIITESSLQRSPDGLQGIYDRILALLDNELKLLLSVMQHSKLAFLVKGYRFLVNCFWSEVESRLEIHLASIFAPGNPKIFYLRYNDSMLFVKKLESYCPDEGAMKNLRESAEYKSFQKRWNLPVYFQIRFQEIAGAFEATLQNRLTRNSSSSEFLLKETQACWKSLQDCWSEEIYIEALAHKFWKLSLQLISRYCTWVQLFCDKKSPPYAGDPSSINKELINDRVHLYLDTQKLLERLPSFLLTVKSKVNAKGHHVLSQSLSASEQVLHSSQPKIKDAIVSELFGYYSTQLKQVIDIPRLYRKTNRSIPSKPCNYIETVAKAVSDFQDDLAQRVDGNFMSELLATLFRMTTDSYYKSVEDVLTSVQKTEDSLRRLKQIRERTPQQSTDNSTGLSDGDKIRLQLSVDVSAYCKLIEAMKIDVNSIDKFKELNHMVTEAVKSIDIK